MNTITLEYSGEERTAVVLSEHENWSHCFQIEPKPGFRSYKHAGMGNVKAVSLNDAQLKLIPEQIKKDQGYEYSGKSS